LRGLGATYDDHLRLIGKRVVDFLLVLIVIELFSLVVTAEALQAYGIKIWTDLSTDLSQCTRLTDGRTDRQISLDKTALHSVQRNKKPPRARQKF